MRRSPRLLVTAEAYRSLPSCVGEAAVAEKYEAEDGSCSAQCT